MSEIDRFVATFRSTARLEGDPPTLYLVPEPATHLRRRFALR